MMFSAFAPLTYNGADTSSVGKFCSDEQATIATAAARATDFRIRILLALSFAGDVQHKPWQFRDATALDSANYSFQTVDYAVSLSR
jgi:hypothetical protein